MAASSADGAWPRISDLAFLTDDVAEMLKHATYFCPVTYIFRKLSSS